MCKIGFILAESGLSRWFVHAGIAVGVLLKLGPMLPRSLRKILKPKSSMQQKVITRSGAGTVARRDLTGNTSVNVMTVGGSANGQLKIPASKYRPSD